MMSGYYLGFTLVPILFCVMVSACWFLIRRKQQLTSAGTQDIRSTCRLDLLIILLCFLSIFAAPIRLRSLIMEKILRHYGNLNIFCILAMILSLFRIRRWTWVELAFACLWCLMLIPLAVSDTSVKPYTNMIAVCQQLLPLFLVLYPMNPASRKKTTGLFLILFDILIALVLLYIGVEYLSDRAITRAVSNLAASHNLDTSSFTRMLKMDRIYSIWGHPLTNAVLFNSFFVLNVIWLRANGRKCPTLLFFLISLAGVLLTVSKTGICICFLLLIAANWKNKKWFLLCIPILVLFYFLGIFDAVIARFASGSLTSGRLEALQKYMASGIEPFRFLSGYGTNTVLSSSHPLTKLRAAFEFPLLMFSHDFGILFAVVHLFGLFAYASWRFLRKKNWLAWICWTLVFAEVNTFNAYALRSQDDCWIFCLLTMILLNTADLSASPDPAEGSLQSGSTTVIKPVPPA